MSDPEGTTMSTRTHPPTNGGSPGRVTTVSTTAYVCLRMKLPGAGRDLAAADAGEEE